MVRQGITPVVAMVLLLFMTVAVAGTAYVWFSGILEGQQEAVQQELRTSVGFRDVQCSGDTVTIAVSNTGESQLSGRNFSVFVYSQGGDLVAQGSHSMDDVAFARPGEFGTATVTLDGALPEREYTVELMTANAEARGRCSVTQFVETTCPTSGNVTIVEDCQYAPGNYTVGNLTVAEGATVHFLSDISCGEATCSLTSGERKTLLVSREELVVRGSVTAGSSISVVSPQPVVNPVVLVGNTSVSVTGAVVDVGS